MANLTAKDIVTAIRSLTIGGEYYYVSERQKFKLVRIEGDEGPIVVNRNGKNEKITISNIWRIANALSSGEPIHVDALFQASGNTRAILEALLANTERVFVCRPKRYEYQGESIIVKDHSRVPKHIFWDRENTHAVGVITQVDTQKIVSTQTFTYSEDVVEIGNPSVGRNASELRMHVQKQYALMTAAKMLGLKAAIPANDGANKIKGERIDNESHMVRDLSSHPLLNSENMRSARETAKLIDCLWLDFSRNDIPAIFEVEHSTGIETGLARMLQFKHQFMGSNAMNVIVAPDKDREKVLRLSAELRYKDLNMYFMPYSKVDELFLFLSKGIKYGISTSFIKNFMEKCPQPHRET